MQHHTDWLIAAEAEADEIMAAHSQGERPDGRWPRLPMAEDDLARLWEMLGGPRQAVSDHSWYAGNQGGGASVALLAQGFVEALAAMGKAEQAAGWDPQSRAHPEVTGMLADMAEFARRAVREGKRVFHLSVG